MFKVFRFSLNDTVFVLNLTMQFIFAENVTHMSKIYDENGGLVKYRAEFGGPACPNPNASPSLKLECQIYRSVRIDFSSITNDFKTRRMEHCSNRKYKISKSLQECSVENSFHSFRLAAFELCIQFKRVSRSESQRKITALNWYR